jgi:HPt (histidine-containing phosphotransfer) domain-containing protein
MNEPLGDKVAAAKARMAELAAKFIDRSAGELDSMRDCLGRLTAGEVGALNDIHHLAHRMCGTGATLGFDGLSDCAMRIERLAEAQPPATLPGDAALTQLGIGIEALGAEIARLRAGRG